MPVSQQNSQWPLLVGLYLIAAAFGASQVFWFNDPLSFLICSVLVPVTAIIWCLRDGRGRGINFRSGWSLMLVLLVPCSILVYLAYTRRWLGVGVFLGNVCGLVFTQLFSFYVCYIVLFTMGFGELFDPMLVPPE